MTAARWLFLVLAVAACPGLAIADDAPYQRQRTPGRQAGVYKDRVVPHWFAGDERFWYRNDLKGGTKEFVLVDAEAGTRGPAFDHAKLAAALSKAAGKEYAADRLPFDDIEFSDDGNTLRFKAGGKAWTCDLTSYEVTAAGSAGEKKESAGTDELPAEDPDDVSPYLEQQPDP